MTRTNVLAAVGVLILLRGVIDHTLTVVEVGAALALLGLVPVTAADRNRRNGNGANA